MKMPALALGRDYLQNAWLVDDLDAAMRHWVETCGVGPFFLMPHVPITDVRIHGRPASLDLSIALAQAGRTQIELIVQHCDAPSPFRDALAGARRPAFHHLAMFAHDYDAELDHYRRQGLPISLEGRFGDMRFCYVDAFATLGCQLELLEDVAQVRTHFAHIAEAAERWDGRDPVRSGY